ncbi:hypothetical protein ACM43_10230 [Bradyrhizobium sp. CCBAU 45321]|uniref:hypothetical protein n=1 Tax=Bradyrhizobium TaxID=374 RepID=UPI0004BB7972|nr:MULTISPECIES: hypothetical protein [Bradyrhizobium]MDA9544876.1 hypothetical protein [Bradyrhizobium sp. CCBAU 45321]
MADETTADERAEIDAEIGRDAANLILGMMQGVPVGVAYNVIGNITVSIFLAVPFVELGDALSEFDSWAEYTRSMIAEGLKGRLQ